MSSRNLVWENRAFSNHSLDLNDRMAFLGRMMGSTRTENPQQNQSVNCTRNMHSLFEVCCSALTSGYEMIHRERERWRSNIISPVMFDFEVLFLD